MSIYFFIPNITDVFEEQWRKDVGFEVGCVDRSAQDVGGVPEVVLQFDSG
jgi:hypothetical protein